MDTNFVWTDLSTFDTGKATSFYQRVLGWSFEQEGDGYYNAHLGSAPCAGLYEMPAFFQKIRMPSFWMTYIAVEDIKAVATKAQELGGKLEIKEDNAKGKVALIRDPAGAGFTCYQGDALAAGHHPEIAGHWCYSELFVSDLALVQDFYAGLFGWTFQPQPDDRYLIHNATGENIGAVQVASEEVKGKKEFWAVYFAVPDVDAALTLVKAAGGQIEGTYPHALGTQGLAYDDQGAAFFLLQNDNVTPTSRVTSSATASPAKTSNFKWKALVGLIAVYFAILLELNWFWGIIFLMWILPDIKRGETYFFEAVNRRNNPILFWAIALTWIALSVLMFFYSN